MKHCEAAVLITDAGFAPVMKEALRLLREEHGRSPFVIDVADSEYAGPHERLGTWLYEDLPAAHAPLPVLEGPAGEWVAIAVSYTSGGRRATLQEPGGYRARLQAAEVRHR